MCLADGIAWFLVLLPFILLFVILGSVMLYQKDETDKRKKNKKIVEGVRTQML